MAESIISNEISFVKQDGELDFELLDLDMSWAFEGADTKYLTHDIHRYPAKFIPQLARRIIEDYSSKGQVIMDPFCGSGTALLEARLTGRNAIGVDLNPVAYYVSKVKSNPIEPKRLKSFWMEFSKKLSPLFGFDKVKPYELPEGAMEILEKWIPEKQLLDMRRLFTLILDVKEEDLREFLLVAFSNIQKDCSWWLMKSVKPTRDFNKKVPDVIPKFTQQVQKMIKKNNELWQALKDSNTWVKVYLADARELSSFIEDEVSLILFSPPYVTSYEYVDVHKLSIIWLEQTDDLKQLKQKFIGSLSSKPKGAPTKSQIALRIVEQLREKDKRLAQAVKAYFEDMQKSFEEMDKVLKDGGVVSIVIGNTTLKKINVKNAEVFAEMFMEMGYKLERVVKRPIPSKNLPTVRDPKTGKFTSVKNHHIKIYPHEFILFLRKGGYL